MNDVTLTVLGQTLPIDASQPIGTTVSDILVNNAQNIVIQKQKRKNERVRRNQGWRRLTNRNIVTAKWIAILCDRSRHCIVCVLKDDNVIDHHLDTALHAYWFCWAFTVNPCAVTAVTVCDVSVIQVKLHNESIYDTCILLIVHSFGPDTVDLARRICTATKSAVAIFAGIPVHETFNVPVCCVADSGLIHNITLTTRNSSLCVSYTEGGEGVCLQATIKPFKIGFELWSHPHCYAFCHNDCKLDSHALDRSLSCV